MKLATRLFGQTYAFKSIKEVLAKANEPRSGDVLAGVAAQSSQERIAAKHGISVVQAILRWHLQYGDVAIPKSLNPERQRQNLDLTAFELDDQDMADISAYFASQKGSVGAADPKVVAHGEELFRGGNGLRVIAGKVGGLRRLDGGKLEFEAETPVDPLTLIKLIQTQPKRYKFEGATMFKFQVPMERPEERFNTVEALFERLLPKTV